MKVSELRLTNFKGFEDLKLAFEDNLTVIVGVNGVGKSRRCR